MFNHLQSPLLNSVKKQPIAINQLIPADNWQLNKPGCQESKNTSVQTCHLHKKNPLLISGSPPPGDTMVFEKTKKMHAVVTLYLNFLRHEHSNE